VVKRSSTSPLGEPIVMLIDVEKEALVAIFDEPKEVGESKRKHRSSSKRGASRQHDDVDSLALEDDLNIPTASWGNSHEGKHKSRKHCRSSTSTETEEYSPYLPSHDVEYDSCFPDSRGGGNTVTPSHIQQQHFSRHDLECYKHVVPQASFIGISPNSVKIREDKAAFEAESRMKDKIIKVYQMY